MLMSSRLPSLLRCSITAALLAIAAPAPAVTVSPDGTGQVLIFPYYTVNEGNQTLISVVNTDDRAKALKVRFREAVNGRNVLEFSLYLDANDSWTAAIFALDAAGAANLATPDRTCTVPTIRTNTSLPQLPTGLRYVQFRNFAYTGTVPGAVGGDDAGSNANARTREGFVEIIEMGTLRPGSTSANAAAIDANGLPANCATLNDAWRPPAGYWIVNAATDIEAPRGGLIGHGFVVDVADGTLYNARPTALAGFRDIALHAGPGTESPTLGDARSFPNGDAVADVFVDGRMVRSTYPAERAVDAVSAALVAEQLVNDYNLEPGLGARTDWVVTLPTKQFYADQARVGAVAVAPFTQLFATSGNRATACENAAITVLDRDAQGPARACATYASDPGACALADTPICGQVDVLSFGNGSPLVSVLAGAVPGVPANSAGGFARLDLGNQGAQTHALRASLEGHVHQGLPAIGFAGAQFINGTLSGSTLANYADGEPHHTLRACSGGSTETGCAGTE